MTTHPSPGLSPLEPRMLLAGDVSASIVERVLDIQGDDASNRVILQRVTETLRSDFSRVVWGKTSVGLDAALLADAASLNLSSVDGTARPAAGLDVAFRIARGTDFSVDLAGGLGTADGSILHRGTVSFNDDTVTVGDFTIGFDPARATGDASGYFVQDTVAGLGVLFDLSVPGTVDVDGRRLTLGDADLLVAPEFAGFLSDNGLAAADLTGADVGDAQVNAYLAQQTLRRVDGGATSVDLDFDLLASAANLNLTGADATADAADGFAVAFDINHDASLIYDTTRGFAPVSGAITHTGSVTFNDAITVGDFTIGFDPARAAGDASGFFVADTLSLNLPLFDVGAPDAVDADRRSLDIGPADLLVSPEFAAVLADDAFAGADLTGAVVGSALINADAITARAEGVRVSGGGWGWNKTAINGGRSATISLADVDGINLDLGDGNDRANARFVNAGFLNADLGTGNDRLTLTGGRLGDLGIDAGSGDDYIALYSARVAGNATVGLGEGRDTLFTFRARVTGDALFTAGEDDDRDRFYNFRSSFGSLTTEGF